MTKSESNRYSFVPFLSQEELDALIIHLVFAGLCGLILFVPTWIYVGLRISLLVITYLIAIPVLGNFRGHSEWLNVWLFSIILSIFQFFPDWFLSAQLNILVFPEDGFLKIDTVSIYMAGLWTIPLFMIIFIGLRMQLRSSRINTYFIVGFVSLLIFGLSEQFLVISWHAQNVTMIGNIALYILIPEILLGVTTFWMYLQTKDREISLKIGGVFLVMILYLGNACFFYFLIEKIILPLF